MSRESSCNWQDSGEACTRTPGPGAADLGSMSELRRAEFARIRNTASEAPKRLMWRVKGRGAAVGVSAVALHLEEGKEDAAEGAAQVHSRVACKRHSSHSLTLELRSHHKRRDEYESRQKKTTAAISKQRFRIWKRHGEGERRGWDSFRNSVRKTLYHDK